MSTIKRHLEDVEAQYQQGLSLCIEAGAIVECDLHEGTYYQGDAEVQEVYALANRKISRGELGPATPQGRRQVTDAIKKAYDDNSMSTSCEQFPCSSEG